MAKLLFLGLDDCPAQPLHTFGILRKIVAPFRFQILEGNPQQLMTQLYGVAVTLVWSGVATFVLLKLVGLFTPLRATVQQELEGLDITQHGEALQ